ncbi:MAG: serine kinase, partial [Clostridiaceae bacterium]|nr:serine kinase [Clostridiaceae bacterium]
KQDQVWVTIQAHQNIVAVASLINLSAILLAGNVLPDKKTVDKANEEDITMLGTKLSAFEVVGRMYKLGISGD